LYQIQKIIGIQNWLLNIPSSTEIQQLQGNFLKYLPNIKDGETLMVQHVVASICKNNSMFHWFTHL